ncbi:MAG TPA: hypothetical protein VNI83_13590 [Vicinamibacterales bacterium]|nr:hypothetical protein [Vicinamibacterales bacterium]
MKDPERRVALRMPIDQAVSVVVRTLRDHGFTILGAVEVASEVVTGPYRGRYAIVSAVHPASTRKALRVDPDLGALFVCPLGLQPIGDRGTVVVAPDLLSPLAALGAWCGAWPEAIEAAADFRDRVAAVLHDLRRRERAAAA